MSTEASMTPVSYWVRRKREQDAALTETETPWSTFVENEASWDRDVLDQRAS